MGFVDFSSTTLIVTIVLIMLSYLFEPGFYEDPLLAVSGVVVAYLLALVLLYIYRNAGHTELNKVIAFDAGGVYFQGNYFTDEINPREGFDGLITDLKAKGHTVIMLTNQNKLVSDFIADKFGLNDVFDQIFSSGSIRIAKPDPRVFTTVIEQLGVNPKTFVFVDDYLPNVEGAKKAGVTGIQFQSIDQLRLEFRKQKIL